MVCIVWLKKITTLNLFLLFALSLGKEFLNESLFVARASLDRGFSRLGLARSRAGPDTNGGVGANEAHGELLAGRRKMRDI